MHPNKRWRHMSQSGQAVLISLLVLTVAMTVVLSLVSRTTTDTSLTNEVEDSARAFNAAEAGIEQALVTGIGQTATITAAGQESGTLTYTTQIESYQAVSGKYTFPRSTAKGDVETLWLVPHNGDGTLNESVVFPDPSLTLCWKNDDPIPAVELILFYKRGTQYRVARNAFDPDATRQPSNNFQTTSINGCGDPESFGVSVNFAADFGLIAGDTPLFLRFKPLYNNTHFVVQLVTPLSLPVQGNKIESTGSTGTGVSRKVVVYQQYRAPIGIFDNAVYSQENFGH